MRGAGLLIFLANIRVSHCLTPGFIRSMSNNGIRAQPTTSRTTCTTARTACTVVVVGAAGNVGRGILDAVVRTSSPRRPWSVVAIDPAISSGAFGSSRSSASGSNNACQVQVHRSTLEEVSEEAFDDWFHDSTHVEFIYTAEDGNRDNYATRPVLGEENDARFETFANRVASHSKRRRHVRSDLNDKRQCLQIHISYIGGSWTRRQAMDGVVSDSSPAKMGGGSNPYEIAKTSAEANARRLAKNLGLDTCISFFDYISVVPNFAPNFSVNRMASSAVHSGVIQYSPGDYGRPLLHSRQAGEMVVSLMERRIENGAIRSTTSCSGGNFEVVLIPGHFVPFRDFATIAKNVVETSGKRESIVLKELKGETPEALKARCMSKHLEEAGLTPDAELVMDGLRQSAEGVL